MLTKPMKVIIYQVREWISEPFDGDKLTIFRQEKPEKPENVVEERDSINIPGKEKEENQVEYIDELVLEEIIRPENDIQIIDQMEILKEAKPENEIAYIEELNIPELKKEPLFIENSDMLSIVVDVDYRIKVNNKKCIIQERDEIELLSLEKEPNQVEYKK